MKKTEIKKITLIGEVRMAPHPQSPYVPVSVPDRDGGPPLSLKAIAPEHVLRHLKAGDMVRVTGTNRSGYKGWSVVQASTKVPYRSEEFYAIRDRLIQSLPSNSKETTPMPRKAIYLIGSLRNEDVPMLAARIREIFDVEVFASWFAAGPEADDYWKKYESARGLTYKEALADYACQNVVSFDKRHLDRCDMAILCGPAGKSGHLEVGYATGAGKTTFYYLPEEPEADRWDAMPALCSHICVGEADLIETLRGELEAPSVKAEDTLDTFTFKNGTVVMLDCIQYTRVEQSAEGGSQIFIRFDRGNCITEEADWDELRVFYPKLHKARQRRLEKSPDPSPEISEADSVSDGTKFAETETPRCLMCFDAGCPECDDSHGKYRE